MPDEERSLLLQCVLTGKAQEAYASLNKSDSKKYDLVKVAVLRAFEFVPEAYRLRFGNMRKQEKQTRAEFVRYLESQWTLVSRSRGRPGRLCGTGAI